MVFKPLDPEILRYVPSTPPGLRIAKTACAPSSSALVPFREPILHGWATLSIGEPSSAGFVSRRPYSAAYSQGIAYYDLIGFESGRVLASLFPPHPTLVYTVLMGVLGSPKAFGTPYS